MSKPLPTFWKKFTSTALLIGAGGFLGFVAGGMTSSPLQSDGVGSGIPASPNRGKPKEIRDQSSAAAVRRENWLKRCHEASGQSVSAWAEALASAPANLMWDPAWREELARFVTATGPEGVTQGMRSGISGQELSMTIAKQDPARIPKLIEALFTDPTLLSRVDFGQIAFDASHARDASELALAPLAKHLLTFYAGDQAVLDDFGATVGLYNLDCVKAFVQNIPSEESGESILSAAILARARSMPAGPALTSDIENFVVGVPALKAAFRKAGRARGNAKDLPATLAWTRSLDGYQQKSALEGWIDAVSEEHPVTEPLSRLLSDPESMKDAAFFTKVLELTTPAITKQGPSAVNELSALLESRPDRLSILEAQPKLKALIGTDP